MRTRLLITAAPLVVLLSISTSSCKKECPQGYGLSSDGECYPFSGDGDADTDSDSDSDSDTDGDTDADGLEIKGTWTTSFGDTHIVEEEKWSESGETEEGTFLSIFHIQHYSNDDNYVVMENDGGNDFDAGLWSRFHWAWVGSSLYYCPISFSEQSESAAMTLESPDSSDPVNGGCLDLGWIPLSPG